MVRMLLALCLLCSPAYGDENLGRALGIIEAQQRSLDYQLRQQAKLIRRILRPSDSHYDWRQPDRGYDSGISSGLGAGTVDSGTFMAEVAGGDGDQESIQGAIDRLDDADRLPDNTSGAISPLDLRNSFTDTIQTLQFLHAYQCIAYHADGTKDFLDFTDATDAPTRHAELDAWLEGSEVQEGDTIVLAAGYYTDDVGDVITISDDKLIIYGQGCTIKRGDAIQTSCLVDLTGDQITLSGVWFDGNRDNVTVSSANCDNLHVSGERCTVDRVYSINAPKTDGVSYTPWCFFAGTASHGYIIKNCYALNGGDTCYRLRASGQVLDSWSEYTDHKGSSIAISSVSVANPGVFTTGTAHGLNNDDRVYFTATSLPGGLDANEMYWVQNKGSLTFEVALKPAGTSIEITSSGTAPVCQIMGNSEHRFIAADSVTDEAQITIRGGGVRTALPLGLMANFNLRNTQTQASSVTVDTGANDFTKASHGLNNGDLVALSGTALPAPFQDDQHYWVVNASTDDFQLAYYEGGPVIDITSTGTAVTVTETNVGWVNIEDFLIDAPHRNNISNTANSGFIKFGGLNQFTAKNVRMTPWSGKGRRMAFLWAEGPDIAGAAGFAPRISMDHCKVDGGITGSAGYVSSYAITNSELGWKGAVDAYDGDGYIFQDIDCDNFYIADTDIHVGNHECFRWGSSTDRVTFFGERVRFFMYPLTGENHWVNGDYPDNVSRGGFANSSIVNCGAGNALWDVDQQKRMLMERASEKVILWKPTTYGAGAPSSSNDDHPANPLTVTGRTGETIQGENGCAWRWDEDNDRWVMTSPFSEFLNTTDNTPTTIWSFETESNTAYTVTATVTAKETVDSDEVAGYKLAGTFRNDGGTLTLVGSDTSYHTAEDTVGWDCEIKTDGATAMIIEVTGGVATTDVNWRADVWMQETE